MNLKSISLFLIAPLVLGSCGTMQTVKQSTVAMAAKFPKMPSLPKFPSISKPGIFGDHPKVAEVREKDLKKLPLGHERLVAYQNGAGGWWPMGDVKFEPAALPDPGADMDPSLLPPP